MEDPRLPVSILTGFLGSGKTTLVNRLLAGDHGQRIAVLVNEFGDVPVDGSLVVRSDEEVVELANGCICCSVRGDLVAALGKLLRARDRLLRPRRFDRVVIETSGLASPGPVLQTLRVEPELSERFRAAGVVTLVHAGELEQELERHPEVVEQLGYAELVLLNHTDQVAPAQLEALEQRIATHNPFAERVRTERAVVDVDRVLALGHDEERELRVAAAARPHAHTEDATTVVLETDRELDLARLKMWLQFLATKRDHELWRLKGLLACRGHAQRVRVQGVYQFLELGPDEEPAPDSSVLVLIGRDLDREELTRGWAASHAEA